MLRQIKKMAAPIALLLLVVYVDAAVRPPYAVAQPAQAQGEMVPLPANYAEGLHDEAALQALSEHFEQTGARAASTGAAPPELSEDEAQRALAALPTGGGAVSAQAAALPSGAATQLGMGESFSTQLSTGGAGYGLSIAMPAARGGVQPRLDLSYNSAGGFGVAGVGWSTGSSAITRQTDRGTPSYDDREQWHPEQDRFSLGGSELVPICTVGGGGSCAGKQEGEVMPVWAAGWQYFRSRIESGFLRIFWSPDHRTWRVQSRDGSNMELGVPLDGTEYSDALEYNPDHTDEIFRWYLARQYDSQGGANNVGRPTPVNTVYYRYLADGNTRYLSDIYDTSPAVDPTSTDLRTFAHHTRLNYEYRPDVATSYRSGFLTSHNLRVAGIDVTSKPFTGTVLSPRSLVRRYHLSYEPDAHRSLLLAAQLEGRCDSAILEDADESLPLTGCPRLPAVSFEYQRIAGPNAPLVDSQGLAFDAFVEQVQELPLSPPHSLDEALTGLMDVNADGLPDVLVTAPGLFEGGHGLFPLGLSSDGEFGFGERCRMNVQPAGDVLDAGGLMLNNSRVSTLDLDADGVVNLLHLPRKNHYSVFSPKDPFTTHCPDWVGREVVTVDREDAKIDFTGTRPDTRVMDVNGDGLVDIVHSSPTEMQTFFALGRLPEGHDQFGHGAWTGPDSADLSTDPVLACAPWSSQAVLFGDSDTRVADMNGDGLADIVRVRDGQILYWPGRGNGFWGTGDRSDCVGDGGFASDRHITMARAPHFGTTRPGSLLLSDINGDGLADMVELRNNAVDIYLNDNGMGFTERHIIANTPFLPSDSNYARLTDIDGSGTPDILWGRAHEYKYIDLTGGRTPHLLTRVHSGTGKTFELEYESSTDHMLAAEAAGKPWARTAPVVVPVLIRSTVYDNLDALGRPAGIYETTYEYRDPVYEGRQREFRGFSEAIVTLPGDAYSPTTHQRTLFRMGECPAQYNGDPEDVCSPGQRWKDNWREALKGTPLVAETFDDEGVYMASQHTSLELRQLYTGLDGRRVVSVYTDAKHSFIYDSADHGEFDHVQKSVSLPGIRLNMQGVQGVESESIITHSQAGTVHVASRGEHDNFGNALRSFRLGCVEGCPSGSPDETLTAVSTFTLPEDDGSGWLYREQSSFIAGNRHLEARRQVNHEYDSRGQLLRSHSALSGTLPLDRFHATGQAIAPLPPEQSVGQGQTETIQLVDNTYDEFGHIVFVHGANDRCSDGTVDELYAQLPISARVYAGDIDPLTGCGDRIITNHVVYDRGLGAPLSTHNTATIDDVLRTLDPAQVQYDGFGRTIAATGADPAAPGKLADVPSMKIEYVLPTDPDVTPYTLTIAHTQTGATVNDNNYITSYGFSDSLGRQMVMLTPADKAAGDGGAWVASGDVVYSRKGLVAHECLPEFYDGSPLQFDLGAIRNERCTTVETDAFSRPLTSYALDGTVTSHVEHHALAEHVYDANDLKDGTFVSSVADGHGRTVLYTERLLVDGAMQERHMLQEYLPTGEASRVIQRTAGQPDVVRWMRYDSLGRMVLNVEPNTSVGFSPDPETDANSIKAWRYAYNDSGDIVGVSDARGCGSNYHYDAGGRMLAVDTSPCEAHHAPYTAPDLLTGYGTEEFYRYDRADPEAGTILSDDGTELTVEPANLWGRLASVSGAGTKAVLSYDALGRAVAGALRVRKPGPFIDADPALRYTPRWYVTQTDYDARNRVTRATTGVTVQELQGSDFGGLSSELRYSYTERGIVKQVDSSYGTLFRGATYDANGLPLDLTLGDAAATQRHFIYDVRNRVERVMTDRSNAPQWSLPSYQSGATGSEPTHQLLLEEYEYLRGPAGNITDIYDHRNPGEWPGTAKPVNRHFEYDDLYRLTKTTYDYRGQSTAWISPFDRENRDAVAGVADPSHPQPSPQVNFDERVLEQTYAYDWLGNISATGDDADGFWDRSTGDREHGGATAVGPHQLSSASNRSTGSSRAGDLDVAYDAGGNVTDLIVRRDGPCLPTGATCWQRFEYEWDELGNISRAQRWDLPAAEQAVYAVLANAPPTRAPEAELRYGYDGSSRVLKTAVDANNNERHTVYVTGGLELRSTVFDYTAGDYVLDPERVSLRLPAGPATARVLYSTQLLPSDPDLVSDPEQYQHVFLELADHLGSNSFIIDLDTGELVEFSTYQAYGATESDYRPGGWDNFREPYKFSGKEEDIEVGLQYFGARYYSPYLGVWLSPDPVTIHDLGSDRNPYSYVAGRPVMSVDPDGREAITGAAIAIGALIGALIATTASIVIQASNANWDFSKVKWGWDGVAGAAIVGAVAGAVTAGTGGLGGAAGSAGAVALGSVNGAAISTYSYFVQSAMSGSKITGAGVATAMIGGAVGGVFGGAGAPGIVGSITSSAASSFTSMAFSGDWSGESFALSLGMATAGVAIGTGIGLVAAGGGGRGGGREGRGKAGPGPVQPGERGTKAGAPRAPTKIEQFAIDNGIDGPNGILSKVHQNRGTAVEFGFGVAIKKDGSYVVGKVTRGKRTSVRFRFPSGKAALNVHSHPPNPTNVTGFEHFSSYDIRGANRDGINRLLVTADGEIKAYSPKTKEISIIRAAPAPPKSSIPRVSFDPFDAADFLGAP